METKSLLYGLIGFFLGGLLVSLAATTFDRPDSDGTSMTMMTSELERKTGDDYDKAFLSHMIEHHESALDMAELSATNAKHDELKSLSRDIMEAQKTEIDLMKRWQVDWGYGETMDGATHRSH